MASKAKAQAASSPAKGMAKKDPKGNKVIPIPKSTLLTTDEQDRNRQQEEEVQMEKEQQEAEQEMLSKMNEEQLKEYEEKRAREKEENEKAEKEVDILNVTIFWFIYAINNVHHFSGCGKEGRGNKSGYTCKDCRASKKSYNCGHFSSGDG